MTSIALTDAPRELAKFGARITYRKLYGLVLDGIVPAERASNGRWIIKRTALPGIAKSLGSKVPAHAEIAPAP